MDCPHDLSGKPRPIPWPREVYLADFSGSPGQLGELPLIKDRWSLATPGQKLPAIYAPGHDAFRWATLD